MRERCPSLPTTRASRPSVDMLKVKDGPIPGMEWGKWSELFSLLDKYPKIVDRDQKNLRDELDREAVEEIVFQVTEKLQMPLEESRPLDESRWCPVAVELIENLSKATARTLWQNHDRTSLVEIFIKKAEEAASEIKNPASLTRLAFGEDFKDPFVCPEESSVQPAAKKTGQSSKLIVVRTEDGPSSNATFVGRLKAADNVSRNIDAIHTEWYLAHQVYFVVVGFSKVYLPVEEEDRSFQNTLRSCLEISPEVDSAMGFPQTSGDTRVAGAGDREAGQQEPLSSADPLSETKQVAVGVTDADKENTPPFSAGSENAADGDDASPKMKARNAA